MKWLRLFMSAPKWDAPAFLLEAFAAFVTKNQIRRNDFNRDRAMQSCVPCTINLAHTAGPGHFEDLVLAETHAVRKNLRDCRCCQFGCGIRHRLAKDSTGAFVLRKQ